LSLCPRTAVTAWNRGRLTTMLLTLTIPLWGAPTIPEGVSLEDFYGGFYPTEEWVTSLGKTPARTRQNAFQSVRIVNTLPDDPKGRWPGPIASLTHEDFAAMQARAKRLIPTPSQALLGLVPRRNRIAGNARVMPSGTRIPCPDRDGGRLEWQADEPDTIRCSKGHTVDPFKTFPPTGVIRITSPAGGEQEYPYHDTVDGGKRIYLTGEYMTPLRVAGLVRTARDLATVYAVTGAAPYAERAAVILLDFARAIAHWPKIARGIHSGLEGKERFRPIGDYRVYAGIWYDKYHSGTGTFPRELARAYDLVASAPVWRQLGQMIGEKNARAYIEEKLFLYTVRDAVRYDIHHPKPSSALSNYIPYQINGFLAIGRAIGLAEIVHYAYWKEQQLARKTLMADSMFPESPSYARQHVYGMARAARLSEGYSDPPGFVSQIDNTRFDSLDMLRDLPELSQAIRVLETLTYPDGENMLIHDTYGSLRSRGFPAPEQARPLLYPAFGHGVLGRGEHAKGNQFQAHLHYSGNWGHAHLDMLNLILWSHGTEMVSDIGYAHTYRMFANNTSGHNLVVVDRRYQTRNLNTPGELVAWFPSIDGPQVIDVSAPSAYPQCSSYRRTLFLLPVNQARNVVLDVFEVDGGSTHEWMAQGSCMVQGDLAVSLPTASVAESYADDGAPFTPPASSAYMKQRREKGLNAWWLSPDEKDPWYGVFRDVCKGRLQGRLAANFTYDSPGAPQLHLRMLQPLDATVYTCTVPSLRRTWSPTARREVHERVEQFRMPKLIVRREGMDLTTRFVALWEPSAGLGRASVVRDLAPNSQDVVAVEIRTGTTAKDQVIRAFHCPSPDRRVSLPGGIEMTGRYAVLSEGPTGMSITLYGVDSFVAPQCVVTLPDPPELPLLSLAPDENGGYNVVLEGTWPGCAASSPAEHGCVEHVLLTQDTAHHRAFPVDRLEEGHGKTFLHCPRHPGFSYDLNSKTLKELFLPFNTTKGKALVRRQRRVVLRSSKTKPEQWHVQTSSRCRVNGTDVAPTPMGTETAVPKL
jgi:hypothetical protein